MQWVLEDDIKMLIHIGKKEQKDVCKIITYSILRDFRSFKLQFRNVECGQTRKLRDLE